MRSIWVKSALFAVAFDLSSGIAAARADSLSFTIFKENDPIGHDSYMIDRSGDQTTVKVETQTDVKVLFLEFHYRQDRTEVWRDGKLQSLVSDTNDDGTKHHVEVKRDGEAIAGVADGAKKSVPGSTVPFTLWTREFLHAPQMLDVSDFDQLKVGIEDKGADQIAVDGKSVATHHYHLTGDLSWDLWYGPDDILLKTAFRRRGYPISFIRE
jgi:hypothetical protein